MPNYENNHSKGILYITFDIDFPREISLEDREALKTILAKYQSKKSIGENELDSDKISDQHTFKFYNGLRGY